MHGSACACARVHGRATYADVRVCTQLFYFPKMPAKTKKKNKNKKNKNKNKNVVLDAYDAMDLEHL